MISVDRSSVEEPKVLRKGEDSPGEREIEKAIEFYSLSVKERSIKTYKHFPFKIYKLNQVKSALKKLFHNKCAYCESKTDHVASMDIEHYRPKSGVVGSDGRYHETHYYWLANNWDNLLIACQNCNRQHKTKNRNGELEITGKANQFPIEYEGDRAPELATATQLKDEKPLILNPCEDNPDDHLVFLEDGTVVSETTKGQVTIDILGLNRQDLMIRRSDLAARINKELKLIQLLFDRFKEGTPDDANMEVLNEAMQFLQEAIKDKAEFAGMARQLISTDQLISDFLNQQNEKDLPRQQQKSKPDSKRDPFFEFDEKLREENIEKREEVRKKRREKMSKASSSFDEFKMAKQSYSLENEEDFEKYFKSTPKYVEEVEIVNFKSIRNLTLNFLGDDESDELAWTMILGENGTGKSTILQAITIALIGKSYFDQLTHPETGVINPLRIIRDGETKGHVSVKISGFTKPRKVTFHSDGRVDFSESEYAQTLVLAYGSTRLMPREGHDPAYGKDYARVDNLFDPFLPMANVNLWLSSLDESQFEYTARKIEKLLRLKKDQRIVLEEGTVYVLTTDGKVPVQHLSDGYQSTMALIADILKVVLHKWPDPELAQGIVILDEVGNHLHPEWKMRFVNEMRSFFPRVQFISSTHNPLCLSGLKDGEVIVLKRNNRGGVYQVTDVPTITGLRVDQILTSEHFGLGSTNDPQVQLMLDRYYELLRKRKKTKDEQEEIAQLKEEIDKKTEVGNTKRERLLLQVIDHFLADKDQGSKNFESMQQDPELMQKLQDIWNS